MKVNPFIAPAVVVVALLGSVFGAQAAGLWSTSGRTAVNLRQMAPADIKGWMTLQQVSEGVGIPHDELYALAGVPADVPATTALKELEKLAPGFEVSSLRDALAEYVERRASPTPAESAP
jgi:hypothetical protein